jgi:hypothetical protein
MKLTSITTGAVSMKVNKDIEFELTPEQVAEAFINADHEFQSKALNSMARLIAEWDKPFCFQLSAVSQNRNLTDEARSMMGEIGEYSEKS